MKYIKLLLISALTFFVLFTLIGLLFPSSVNTVKAVVINKKQADVLAAVNISGSWIKWYPFFDPPAGAAVNNANADTTVFSNNKKELYILDKKTTVNTVSFSILDWNGGTTAETIAVLPISGDSSQTQVMWKETQHLKWYPWDRFRGLLLEGTKGLFLDSALNRFKVYMEAAR